MNNIVRVAAHGKELGENRGLGEEYGEWQHTLHIEEDPVDYYFDAETEIFDGTGVACSVSNLRETLQRVQNAHRLSQALRIGRR